MIPLTYSFEANSNNLLWDDTLFDLSNNINTSDLNKIFLRICEYKINNTSMDVTKSNVVSFVKI